MLIGNLLGRKFKELLATLYGAFDLSYCSNRNPYITRVHKLSVDIESLAEFIDSAPIDNEIDADEAVEDALHETLNLNWSEINTRSIVLFGDARPHEPNECDKGYDYFRITEQLYKFNTTINTVYCSQNMDYRRLSSLYEVEIGDFSHCVSRLDHAQFFSWIANVTGGVAIGVEQIDDIVDIIKAMAAKDAGKIEGLEKEEAKLTSKPIPVLKHIKERAKQIDEKKKILGIGYSKKN